ncbi:MAG: amidase, partial [Acidimicrobiales bacterium]
IRIPAAMCGLVGLKPNRGRVSMGPYQDEWGLSVQHVVFHTVRDSASILDVTAIPTLGDGVVAPSFGRPYADLVSRDPEKLRIGAWNKSPRDNLTLNSECAASVDSAAALLAELGHDVAESHPTIADDPDVALHFSAVWVSYAAANVIRLGEMIGRELSEDDVEPATWAMAEMGRGLSAVQLTQAQAAMHTFRRDMAEWWENGWDVLLTPTTMEPPPLIGELTSTPDEPLRASLRSIPYGAYTSMFNVTGQPAISLPLNRTADGLPVGVQLVAAYGREDLLLGVASQLERTVGWTIDQPPIHA